MSPIRQRYTRLQLARLFLGSPRKGKKRASHERSLPQGRPSPFKYSSHARQANNFLNHHARPPSTCLCTPSALSNYTTHNEADQSCRPCPVRRRWPRHPELPKQPPPVTGPNTSAPAVPAVCRTVDPVCTSYQEKLYHMKMYYNRKNGITPEEFNRYWANEHGKLTQPFHIHIGVIKYLQVCQCFLLFFFFKNPMTLSALAF